MNHDSAPLVTAVIPVYNHEKYVIETIRSILDQSYRNIELIIINDGSSDRSHEMVLTVAEECRQRCKRFEYINRKNIGLSATLNQALSMATGKYFSAMASDDIALQDKFSVLVEALESADDSYAAAFGNAFLIDDQSTRIWMSYRGSAFDHEADGLYDNYLDLRTDGGKVFDYRSDVFGSYRTLLSHNCLPASACLVKTDLIRRVGAWMEGNPSEDWEMWRKLSKQHRLLYVDKPLALYRSHDSNSIKVMSDMHKFNDLVMLKNEKQYCAGSGLISVWRSEYAARLLPVLADRRIPIMKKLSALDFSELCRPSFCSYSVRRIARKLTRWPRRLQAA